MEMFSAALPKLQIAWDKTSLKALQFCPTRYNLEILQGWRKDSADLVFGSLFAGAVEVFLKALLDNKSKDDAQREAVRYTLEQSGSYVTHDDHEHFTPWGGTYQEQWHCTGTEKYKNEKGNAAKCPWAHKGKWFDGPAPAQCGTCGSPVESELRYLSDHKYKHRKSLLRLVVWYTEDHATAEGGKGVVPYRFPDGTPAAELSFRIPLPWKTASGETFILAGHIDALKAFMEEIFISENKTTTKTLGKQFFDGYNPSLDVELYDFATNLLYPDLRISGVLLEGAQIMVDGARFAPEIIRRDDTQREEFFHNLEWWLKQAERFAQEDYWPRAEANCWMCPFKDVCRLPPSRRAMKLEEDFVKRVWNPLEER